jgi:putative FmdB family regulatory protein
MPLYEYKCEACGKLFTKLQKFSDPPVTVHEECGSGPVERLISAPAFHFKGSGWYVTDYAKSSSGEKPPSGDTRSDNKPASDSKPADSKAGETKSSGESGGTAAKTETKPAA